MSPSPSHDRIRLYRHPLSGHSHRAELLLSLLGLAHELVDVDLKGQEQKSEAFLRLNPFGQVPVLDDRGTVVPDSNAILFYLALRHGGERFLPVGPLETAEAQRWLSVSSGPLIAGPASARLVTVFGQALDHGRALGIASRLFDVLDAHLSSRRFLAGDRPMLPDISMYSYTAHAPEGGITLDSRPAIQEWLRRMQALDGFIPMETTKVGLLAA